MTVSIIQAVVAIVVALVGGGAAAEYVRARAASKVTAATAEAAHSATTDAERRADMDFFLPTWRQEMERMSEEVRSLRAMVVALSVELQKLGGDPIAIRLSLEMAEYVSGATSAHTPKEQTP